MSFLEVSKEWEYKFVHDLTLGINSTVPDIMLDDGENALSKNLHFEKRKVVVDTGYAKFGGVVRGNPRIDFQFFKTDGTSELVLITDTTLYVYSALEWQYVSDGNSTTTTGAEAAGQTVIEVVATTGFTSGDFVGLALSDGTQHRTTVASVSAGVSITLDDAIPATFDAILGAVLLKAVDLVGTLDIQVSTVVLPSHNWFVFTNGVDNVKRYDGTDCTDIPNLPSSGNTQCRLVGIFNNHLILAHTTEGGTRYPQRVRRANTGDPTDWTTGVAGYNDLYDNEDWLIAIQYLGPYMILYRERSIVRTEYVGSLDLLFNFETTIVGEGALSQDSVIDLGDYHIFMGNANIYEYRGGFDFQPVGDKIYYEIFGVNGDLNASYKQRVFGLYVEEVDEAWFFYPPSGEEKPTKLIRYSQENQSWMIREFNHDITGFGLYQSTSDKTWNDLVGTWLQQNWTWDSRAINANSPITHLLSSDNLQVYEYDYFQTTDDGTVIPYEFETKDFGNPRFMTRFDLFEFRLFGTNILVEYSLDEGVTFDTLATFTSGKLQKNLVNKQLITQYIRFRFSGSDAFKLHTLGFMFIQENEI